MADQGKGPEHLGDTGMEGPASCCDERPDRNPVQTMDPAACLRAAAGGATAQESVKAPPSPCVSVCALDENDLCMGCYRTADEITDWFTATPTEKHVILRAAEERRSADGPIRLL